MRKNITALLVLFFFMLMAPVVAGAQDMIRAGCVKNGTASMAYSQKDMNSIMSMILKSKDSITAATLRHDTTDEGERFYYLQANAGADIHAIGLLKLDSALFLTNTCFLYSCEPIGTTPCSMKIKWQIAPICPDHCNTTVTSMIQISTALKQFVKMNPPACR